MHTVNTCKRAGQLRAVQFSIDQLKEWISRPTLVSQRIGITPNAGWIGQAANRAELLGKKEGANEQRQTLPVYRRTLVHDRPFGLCSVYFSHRSALKMVRIGLALLLIICSTTRIHAQDVPDTNLRNILNGIIPGGYTDANGMVLQPNVFIQELLFSFDAELPPMDMTGLQFITCHSFRMVFESGSSTSAFPAFPNVQGPDAVIQLEFFNGPELPPLPSGLGAFFLWDPQSTLQSWHLNGHDDGVPLHVEVIGLQPETPWATVTEHIDYLSIVGYPHVEPPTIGPGIRELAIWGAPEMNTPPLLHPDTDLLTLAYCPQVTTMDMNAEGDTLTLLHLEELPSLTSLTGLPVVVETINFWGLTSLSTVEFNSCFGQLYVQSDLGADLLEFPDGLTELKWDFVDAQLTLPAFPSNLLSIEISSFPTNLGTVLNLPPFPDGITTIAVGPVAPGVCVPWIPSSVTSIIIGGVPCYPNQPPLAAPLTLCTILNSNCPDPNPYVTGHAFLDFDEDGVQSSWEPDARNVTLMAQPTGHMTSTDDDGNYTIAVPVGVYSIGVLDAPPPFTESTPAQYTITLPLPTSSASNRNFRLTAPDGFEVDRRAEHIGHTVARPGFLHDLYFDLSILGLHADTTVITLMIDTALTLMESDLNFEPITSHTLTLRIPPNETSSVTGHLRFYLAPTASIFDSLTMRLSIAGALQDMDPSNDSLWYTYPIQGSYDPNDKQVFPPVLHPEVVATDTLVEYLIRFQNTGTYLAERVLITDTLSTDLRWETFRFMHSSHDAEWFMRDGVVHFVYNDIMLPDSTSDEPGSHGYVRFSIRPSTALTLGTEVPNVANIYFDFNAPVITEPCFLSIDASVHVGALDRARLLFYPMPANDRITVTLPAGETLHGELFSNDGRMVRSFSGLRDQGMLDLSNLAPGSYVVRATSNTGSRFTEHLIKK
jgi:hypothetical protein